MSDSSPILLIIDAQTSKFGRGNEYLVPALTYAQTLYSTVMFTRRRELGRLAVLMSSHSKMKSRACWSAIGALDSFELRERVVHVCTPDIDHSLVVTAGDFAIRDVNFLVLSDLCGSTLGRVSAGGEMSYLRRFVGSSRLVRAADVAPKHPVVQGSMHPALAEIRPKLHKQLVSADGSFEELRLVYGILTFAEGSMQVGVDTFGPLRRDTPVSQSVVSSRWPSGRAALIDSFTSASAYRMVAGPVPDGSSAWTAELVAHELVARCMVASISAVRVEQHFEANEKLGVPNPLRVVDEGSSSAAPERDPEPDPEPGPEPEPEPEPGVEVVYEAISPEEMVCSVLELASTAGLRHVAESMGVSEDDVELMLAGEAEWPQRAFQVVGEMSDFLSLFNGELPPSDLPLVSNDADLERFEVTPQVSHGALPDFQVMPDVSPTSGYDPEVGEKESLTVADVRPVQTPDGDIFQISQDLVGEDADVGWVSLSEFAFDRTPVLLRFPDGEERKVLHWVDILYMSAEWLVQMGMISDSDCPVLLPGSREPLLFSGQLPDAYSKSRRYRELPGDFYLRSKFRSARTIKNCQLLLQRFGADLSSFHLYVV